MNSLDVEHIRGVSVSATASRGIVINPGVSQGLNGAILDSGPVFELIRKSLLYWDRIDWPFSTLMRMRIGPTEEFLKSAGVLERTVAQFSGEYTGNIPAVFADAQLTAFSMHEKSEPGQWVLAQSGAALSLPCEHVEAKRMMQVELHNVLPAPAPNVPFEDVLEFKKRYASELLALRSELDAFYAAIIDSGDPSWALAKAKQKLAIVVTDVGKALNGISLPCLPISFSLDLNPLSIARNAAIGSGIAPTFDLPIEFGAAIGAITGMVSVKVTMSPAPSKLKQGPYAYVFHAERELRGLSDSIRTAN